MTMTLLHSPCDTHRTFSLADLEPAFLDDSVLHIGPTGRCVYAMIRKDVGTVDIDIDGTHGTLFDALFVQAPNGRRFVAGSNCAGVLCAGLIL